MYSLWIIEDVNLKSLVHSSDKPEIVLLVGPPASGKSTLCDTFFSDYIRINQDTLKTIAKCIKAATTSLKSGNSVIVDNTNGNKEVVYVNVVNDRFVGDGLNWQRASPFQFELLCWMSQNSLPYIWMLIDRLGSMEINVMSLMWRLICFSADLKSQMKRKASKVSVPFPLCHKSLHRRRRKNTSTPLYTECLPMFSKTWSIWLFSNSIWQIQIESGNRSYFTKLWKIKNEF